MDGPTIMRGLIDRGYSPVQAAALAGHALQESGGDPTNVNKGEDAHGLLQWRLDRWDALKNFARERGVDPTDPNLQLDFIGRELGGSEARAGKGFLAANDVNSASAALKPYIRFGDNSDTTRLNNARGLLGQGPAAAGPISPISPTGQPGQSGTVATANASPASSTEGGAPDNSVAQMLAAIPKQIAEQEAAATPAPLPVIPSAPVITPQMVRARQLAAAMLARSINPGSAT